MTLLFVLFLRFAPLQGEVDVDLRLPELGEGMAQLEALLAENIGPAVSDVETLVNETLDKPLLTLAVGNAVGLSSSMPMLGTLPNSSRYSLSFGGYTALYSYSFDVDALTERFAELTPEDDPEFGAGVTGVSANLTLPLEGVLRGLSLFASLAYSNLVDSEYSLKDLFAQAALGYTPFREVRGQDLFSWIPLHLQLGISFGYNRIGVQVEAGQISEEFEIDPDGGGPLVGQDVEVQINPVVDIGLESRIGTVSFALSTGLRLLDWFSFYLGSGGVISFGRTDIGVESTGEIVVVGYLSKLIEEQGVYSIDGAVEGSSPQALMGYFFGGFQWEISRMFTNVLLLYHPTTGLSGGISLGVSL